MSGLKSGNFGANEICISGRVSAAGAAVSGKGFSASTPVSSVFTIGLSGATGYSGVTSCIITCDEVNAGAFYTAPVVTAGKVTGFTVTTYVSSTGALGDKAFSFFIVLEE